jgi:DNA-binding transcriptional regulator YhcF (GntR family)
MTRIGGGVGRADPAKLADNGSMPVINIDVASTIPPFEQVRSQIAAQIQSGQLPVGARLPTVRGLAIQLELAANTVARAYGELEHAGLVNTRGRAGTTVSASGDQARERAAAAAREYAGTIRGLGLKDADALSIVQAALHAV